MKLKVNDINYFIEIHQKDENKPQLLLLHGFMGSGRVFDLMIPQLKTFCNPITIDLLGHGKTSYTSSSDRFHADKQIEDLEQIISKIANESIYLHGYSMGGRLALQLAQSKSELLKGLILESTNPGLNNREERNERKRLDKQRAKKIEVNFDAFLEEWKNLPLFKSPGCSDDGLKWYDEIQQQQNPQQMAYSLRNFGTGQMPPVELDKIKIPILLLAGEKDERYMKIMKRMSQRISKSRLKIISKAGHRVHVDQSDAMTTKLKTFIKPI